MSGIPPVVRHLLLCREVRRNADDPLSVDVVGLFGTIVSRETPNFPLHVPLIGVYLQIANGRGASTCFIRVRHADTRSMLHESSRALTFASNPLNIRHLFLPIRDCVFSKPGLYIVQILFEDILLAQEPLLVR